MGGGRRAADAGLKREKVSAPVKLLRTACIALGSRAVSTLVSAFR
jgi:hypothetical protein